MQCDMARAWLSLNKKLPFAHNLLFAFAIAEPDVELEPNYIDMRCRLPRRAGVRSVRIAERNMDARKFLILQNVPNHARHADVGSNRKLAHAVGVLIRVGVGPERLLQLLIRTLHAGDAVVADVNCQRRFAQNAEASTEKIADNTIDNKHAVHL